MEEKIKALFEDKAFVEKALKLETPEEVKTCLAEKGIEASVEEIKQARALLEKKFNGELTDEDLENVSGGFCLGLAVGIPMLISAAGGLLATVIRRRW